MSDAVRTPDSVSPGRRIRRFMADRPLIPLIVLLIGLIVVLEFLRPGIVNERWVANTIKFAIPLAILAGCQTMTMLTGGIDLSVGVVATMSAFIMATQVGTHDPAIAILISLVPAALIGLANGIGVGIFRVHPLIMTLGMSLIGTGVLQVYQRTVIATGSSVPDVLAWLGTGRTYGIPNALALFVPIAVLIIYMLRRTGFGRLLYAVGDNEQGNAHRRRSLLAGHPRALRPFRAAGWCRRPALCRPDQGAVPVAGGAASPAFGRGGRHRRHLDLRRAWRLHGDDHRRPDPDRARHPPDGAADAGGVATHPLRPHHSCRHRALYPDHRGLLSRLRLDGRSGGPTVRLRPDQGEGDQGMHACREATRRTARMLHRKMLEASRKPPIGTRGRRW